MKPLHGVAIIAAISGLASLIAPFIGSESIAFGTPWGPPEAIDHTIFWDIRVPRTLTGLVAGATLALSGLAFQAMFRNPLATPFTLGVASGASLGAAIAIRFGLGVSVWILSGNALWALAGALTSVGLVYGLTRARHELSSSAMLLAGVAVSFFFSSLILFIQYTSDFQNSFRLLRALIGGLGTVGYANVVSMLPFAAVGCAAIFFLTRELNLLTMGDDIALSRGLDVVRVKGILFVATSLMVAGVVSVCGPIGFVGMMAPHICRLLVGPDHRYLAPATFFFGGAFLTVCDTFARTTFGSYELPVGVVTAFLGGPFFLWLLVSRTGSRYWA